MKIATKLKLRTEEKEEPKPKTNHIENIRRHHQDPAYLADRLPDRQERLKQIREKYGSEGKLKQEVK